MSFSFLPDDTELTPDQDLEAAAAGALALPEDVTPSSFDPLLPFGKTWIFDFEAGRFVRTGGSPTETRGFGAVEQWCLMAVHCERFAHAVFCVDDATEVLTRNGWMSHDALEAGMEALTLNHETGLSEWQEVGRVNRFDVVDEEMVLIDGCLHSSLTTLAHRWPVIERCGANRRVERRWRESATLTTEGRLITAAPCADLPVTPTVPDELVEAVAWFWTEGAIKQSGRSRQVTLTQCAVAHPEYVKRIRRTLTRLYGAPSLKRMSTGSGSLARPMWREYRRVTGLVHFDLNTRASAMLLDVAPAKVVSPEFILALTRDQLERFVEVSLCADGWQISSGTELIAQKDPRRLAAIELALILLGRTPHTYLNRWPHRTRRERYRMTVLSASRRTTFGIPAQGRRDGGRGGASAPRRVRYTGTVWCPTTPNHTWLARRNGCVYFTGNSDEFGMEGINDPLGEFAEGEILADWERHLTEALLVHDRVSAVENIDLAWDPSEGILYVNNFDVVTDEEERLTLGDIAIQRSSA